MIDLRSLIFVIVITSIFIETMFALTQAPIGIVIDRAGLNGDAIAELHR